TSIFN
ncbi:hypothetical protein ACTA71_011497, partial [Dictyostelium dimigraforme]